MNVDFLKKKGFSQEQIGKVSEAEFVVIRHFFTSQEISNIDKEQIILAAKMLSPTLGKLKIVDMLNYVNSQKGQSISNVDQPAGVKKEEVNPFSVSRDTKNIGDKSKSDDSVFSKKTKTLSKIDSRIEGKYIVQQVWILEHLMNNPNLLDNNENVEKVKRGLREKEIELKIHNLVLNKFFETARVLESVETVINFKHFETIKKDLFVRFDMLKKDSPLDFKGVMDSLIKFGLEDQMELNIGICFVLAELMDDPKLQKLLKYSEQHFKEVDLLSEKKKYLRRNLKD